MSSLDDNTVVFQVITDTFSCCQTYPFTESFKKFKKRQTVNTDGHVDTSTQGRGSTEDAVLRCVTCYHLVDCFVDLCIKFVVDICQAVRSKVRRQFLFDNFKHILVSDLAPIFSC